MTDAQANPDKVAADLAQSRREIESLTYTIAHDLRAPLRTIEGFARALSDDSGEKLDEDGRRYLQHILTASQRMSVMLEGLLGLAQMQRVELRPQKLEISTIARAIVDRLRAEEPGRTVETMIPDGITAEADPTLLPAALEALLQNAFKFTRGRNPAKIEVGMQPATPAVYFVRDNGVGFDMRYAGKLFAPFQRLHSEKEFEGVGIGLATVQHIVRRHGGRIWVEAAPDGGASFHFTLAEAPAGSSP